MKYVILIYSNPTVWESLPATERRRVIRIHNDLIDELTKSGEFLNIYRLAHASNTKTVRKRGGAPVVTDGPFGEAKEVLVSVWEIEVEDLERAIEIASPLAEHDVIEIKPLLNARGIEM